MTNSDKHNPNPEAAAATPGALNLPNKLTLARILMVPVFMVLLSVHHLASFALAYVVFTIATITDYYDGKIARERNLVTNFGKLLDPVADKVLVVTAFIMLMSLPDLSIPSWTVVVIIAREFLITGARSLAASEGVVIAANIWGKTKAVLQMVYIYVFLGFVVIKYIVAYWYPEPVAQYQWVLQHASYWAMIFVAGFTVYSGIRYAQLNWHVLRLGSS